MHVHRIAKNSGTMHMLKVELTGHNFRYNVQFVARFVRGEEMKTINEHLPPF